MSQWDKDTTSIFFDRIRELKGYFTNISSSISLYLFDLKSIKSKEKLYLDELSKLDIFSDCESYTTSELRYHCILRKLLLRLVISKYINKNPLNFSFRHNPYGKPYLPNNLSKVFFNFSHTSDYGFLGISNNKDIGVDIEKITDLYDKNSLLDICACTKEKLWALTDKRSNTRFFTLWTAKEALVKAIGRGFLANSIPNLTALPKKTEHAQYEAFYKEYKILTKIKNNSDLCISICYENDL